jgi:hypothetical protein
LWLLGIGNPRCVSHGTDAENQLPRFNMPLELGVFLGAKRFGPGQHRSKRCLILDRDRYRFQKFISDIAGQDIKAHGDSPEAAIRAVCDWLRNAPGARAASRWIASLGKIPEIHQGLAAMCARVQLTPEHLTFTDFYQLVLEWLSATR